MVAGEVEGVEVGCFGVERFNGLQSVVLQKPVFCLWVGVSTRPVPL